MPHAAWALLWTKTRRVLAACSCQARDLSSFGSPLGAKDKEKQNPEAKSAKVEAKKKATNNHSNNTKTTTKA